MMVSGPTACGKTHFVKTLLQQKMINPPVDRILWFFKRWQPMYDVIRNTVQPPVEFVQGIPDDLERDGYLDVAIRNVIVLDDLMSTASKDPRIRDLFTEGSHHRNLSVIALNQNLYFGKDPTQRRNCHYLALFDNPIDRQQVMTLARQMYPKENHLFMRRFQEATKRPYGYLVVDLKPTTPEVSRLRTNVLSNGIRGDQDQNERHNPYTENPPPIQSSNPKVTPHVDQYYPSEQSFFSDMDALNEKRVQSWYPGIKRKREDELIPCSDCGVVLFSTNALERHIKRFCPENKAETEHEDDSNESTQSWSSLTDDHDGEKKAFDIMIEYAKDHHKRAFKAKVKNYEEKGMNADRARNRANEKLRTAYLKDFLYRYDDLLRNYMLNLRHSPLHKKIMDSVDEYVDDGHNLDKAIRMVLKAHKIELEDFLEEDNDDVEESEEEDDDNEQSETESSQSWLSDGEEHEGEKKAFGIMIENAKKENEAEFKEKVKTYMQKGMSSMKARAKAHTKLRDVYLKGFLSRYTNLIGDYLLNLRHSDLHNGILDTIDEYTGDGHSTNKAIRMVIKTHKNELEEFLDDFLEEDESDEDDESDESDEEDESDEDDDESDDDDDDDDDDDNDDDTEEEDSDAEED